MTWDEMRLRFQFNLARSGLARYTIGLARRIADGALMYA